MKVSELLNTYEAFKELGKKELPFETALIIAENIETLRVPATVAIKKQNETTEKYMDRDDKGNPIKVGEGAYKLKDSVSYTREMKDLDGKEVETGEIKPIPKSVLSGMTIAPVKLAPILKYIK